MLRPTALLFVALAGASTALADVNNTARLSISPDFSGGGGPIDLIVTQPGTIYVSGSTTGGFNSVGSGSARVEYGAGRGRGHDSGSIRSTSSAIFHDSLVITSPGVPTGTPGTLTFTVVVAGSFSATSGSSAAGWGIQADLGGGFFDITRSGNQYSPDLGGAYQGDAPGSFSATISFQFGMPASLDVEFHASAGAQNSSNGPGQADVDATVNWGGIGNVKANGSPVGTFGVSSASGTDWTGQIPGCAADFDASGFVDTDDFDAFVHAFDEGSDDADFDGSGFVDTDDFDAFVHAFETGC